jgi:hypothetical protein
MAKMLDLLEAFLNLHGHTYMRLDGSTKPEQRQVREGIQCTHSPAPLIDACAKGA